MAKRKIIKLKLIDEFFENGDASYYHDRSNPIVLGYLREDGNYNIQRDPSKRSFTWYASKEYAIPLTKPLIMISVENEDTRKTEPQAQNK